MRLGVAAATQIAAFLCGDQDSPFPYRTGRELSYFFTGLGHGYRIEDFSSRAKLAENALIEIDRQTSDDTSGLPSTEIVEVLEALMSRDTFEAADQNVVNYDRALMLINRVLNRIELQIAVVNGKASVQSIDGIVVSTTSRSVKTATKLTFAPSVFHVPDDPAPQDDVVAVMMPFDASFEGVFDAINRACSEVNLSVFE